MIFMLQHKLHRRELMTKTRTDGDDICHPMFEVNLSRIYMYKRSKRKLNLSTMCV